MTVLVLQSFDLILLLGDLVSILHFLLANLLFEVGLHLGRRDSQFGVGQRCLLELLAHLCVLLLNVFAFCGELGYGPSHLLLKLTIPLVTLRNLALCSPIRSLKLCDVVLQTLLYPLRLVTCRSEFTLEGFKFLAELGFCIDPLLQLLFEHRDGLFAVIVFLVYVGDGVIPSLDSLFLVKNLNIEALTLLLARGQLLLQVYDISFQILHCLILDVHVLLAGG